MVNDAFSAAVVHPVKRVRLPRLTVSMTKAWTNEANHIQLM